MSATFSDKMMVIAEAHETEDSKFANKLQNEVTYEPAKIIGTDQKQTKLFLQNQKYLQHTRGRFFITYLRDGNELARKMPSIDTAFTVTH